MNMITREWDAREVAHFNALHGASPYLKLLHNQWPARTVALYVLRWESDKGVTNTAIHFCESEANWRRDVFNAAGSHASVAHHLMSHGESHVQVDARQRPGCTCDNCTRSTHLLTPIPKRRAMSSAQARKLAHTM